MTARTSAGGGDVAWSHVDADNTQITVGPHVGEEPECALVTIDEDGPSGCGAVSVLVPAGEVAAMTSALYRATGKAAPLILDRPHVDLRSTHRAGEFAVGFSSRDGISVTGPGRPVPARAGAARELAAVIAAYADAADREPDPGDVDDLAHAIEGDLAPLTGQARELAAIAAAAALRWVQDRPVTP